MKKIQLFFVLVCHFAQLSAQKDSVHRVTHLKITILSTMLAQDGVGDWGFSALVECDTNKILFDTGGRDSIVRNNARDLHIDLARIPLVVLSHGHSDHTAGWLSLRKEMVAVNKNAFSMTYVGPNLFDERIFPSGGIFNLKPDSIAYEASGGRIETIKTWKEIWPGVYLTGNDIPRVYAEKNYPPTLKRVTSRGQTIPDTVSEDMSMVISTAEGLVLLTGCGHSGTVNLLTAVEKHFPGRMVYAAIGGFHLLAATDEQIRWTAEALKQAGVRYFMGAHCTGIEPVHQIMEYATLKRNECIVGSVGATFEPNVGFIAGQHTMGRDKNAYFKR